MGRKTPAVAAPVTILPSQSRWFSCLLSFFSFLFVDLLVCFFLFIYIYIYFFFSLSLSLSLSSFLSIPLAA